MFIGEYESSIDDKNRVVLPRKFRDAIDVEREGEELYLTVDPDGCLLICPPSEWNRRLQQLDQSPFAKEKLRRFRRYLSSMTEPSRCDKQGRLLLPSRLIQEVGIGKEIFLVGNISVIEVWPAALWTERRKQAKNEFSQDIEDLF